MRRRKVLLLGGSSALWPLGTAAQPSLPIIGFLFIGTRDRSKWWRDAWTKTMDQAGFVKVPAVSGLADFAEQGGLMRYNVLQSEVPSLTANYVVRILKGQKPAELPVQQPTRFALSLNLKTAKALGLALPLNLIDTADQVFE